MLTVLTSVANPEQLRSLWGGYSTLQSYTDFPKNKTCVPDQNRTLDACSTGDKTAAVDGPCTVYYALDMNSYTRREKK